MSSATASAASRLLLVGALAIGAAACGSDDSGSSDGSTTPPKATVKPLTEAEAKVVADASLLKAADLPGFKATPSDDTEDPDEKKAEDDLQKCVGVTTPVYLADEVSDDFSKGEFPASIEVSSEVQVVKTEAEGKAELEAFLSDKALDCFKDFIGTALKEAETEGVTVAKTEVERFDVAKPAEASEAFGLRVKGGLSAAGTSFTFTVDIAGALVGRAELSVLTFAFGDTLPKTELERLLGVMSTRAKTAQG